MFKSHISSRSTTSLLAPSAGALLLGLCAAALGCSGESINMGEDVPVGSSPLPPSSRCLDNPTLRGVVVVANQQEVDELEGCEAVDGDLYIVAFEGANLRALHALESVSGSLVIGNSPDQGQGPNDPPQWLREAWLPSLEGLESLERAGSLTLHGLTAEDLKPLGSLKELQRGDLSIWAAEQLKSFDGLQSLEGLRYLSVSGARRLASFDGLTLPERMESIDLSVVDLQQLKPIGVRTIDRSIYLDHTQLRDMQAFSDLVSATTLQIDTNLALESLAGLENLQYVENLLVHYNRVLRFAPSFDQLFGISRLQMNGSPELTTLPAFPNLQVPFDPLLRGFDQQDFIALRPDLFEVEDLGLTSFTLPRNWSSASVVRIVNNPGLTRVDFTEQTYIDYLTIQRNPALTTVATGVLDKVNVLELLDNPALSVSTFDGVRRLDMNSSGNAEP